MKKFFLWAAALFGCFTITCVLWLVMILGPLKSYLPLTFQVTGSLFSTKTYLILLQNDAEIRPTGGFISTFGELTFAHGIPIKLQIQDVFALKGHDDNQYVKPPYPMEKFLAGDNYKGHSFHDANWSPDLPTSALALLEFYGTEYPEKHVDGIITINFSLIEELLQITGPIQYDGRPIDQQNLFHTIQYTQNNIDRHSMQDLTERKSIISNLAPAVIGKILTNPLLYSKVAEQLDTSIKNKDIAMFSRDSALQKALEERKATNTFPAPSKERIPFAIVEANLGGMKSDRYITRAYQQRVEYIAPSEKEQERLTVTTTVTLTHNGTYNAPLSHEYRGFFRTYIPKDAQPQDLPANGLSYEDLGYRVLGNEVNLLPGAITTFSWTYTLPLSYLHNKQLSVALYQQSGVRNATYESILVAPQDYLFRSASYRTMEQVAYYSTQERLGDQVLVATMEPDSTPPRVTMQSFLDYNKFSIQFNEPVLSYDCSHIPNWEIRDSDTHVPDISNTIPIVSITCSDREAIVQTRNIRTQYGEFFTVTMRNIRDRSNNIISPNPRQVTLVQRFPKDAPDETP